MHLLHDNLLTVHDVQALLQLAQALAGDVVDAALLALALGHAVDTGLGTTLKEQGLEARLSSGQGQIAKVLGSLIYIILCNLVEAQLVVVLRQDIPACGNLSIFIQRTGQETVCVNTGAALVPTDDGELAALCGLNEVRLIIFEFCLFKIIKVNHTICINV